MSQAPTLEEIRRWPAAVSIPRASAALGISKSHGYELVKTGIFPARVIDLRGRAEVVTADLLRVLSVEDGRPDAA